jgi:hypothetical protein
MMMMMLMIGGGGGIGSANSKIKAVLVTCGGDLLCSETSRLPHFPDNRLTDGGEVASRKFRLPSPPTRLLAVIIKQN